METLEQIAERGVAEHERFLADLKAMDYAWLQSQRTLNKPLSEVTIADAIEARKPFDSWLDNYIQREVSRG